MKKFNVLIVREAGSDPLTGQYLSDDQEEMQIESENKHGAYLVSQRKCSLPFFGHIRRIF